MAEQAKVNGDLSHAQIFGDNPANIHDAFEEHARSKKTTDPDEYKEKEKCFRMLLKVASLEDDFQFLQNEIDSKTLFLAKDLTHNHKAEVTEASSSEKITKIHQECLTAVKQNWEWLTAVSKCLPVHLEHSSAYHQFFQQADLLFKGMSFFQPQCEELVTQCSEESLPSNLQRLKKLTGALLQHQAGVEKLFYKAKSIMPLEYRRKLPKDFQIKAKSLLSFTHGEFSLTEGEECTVVDNTNQIAWVVRNDDGIEDEVPPIILILSSLCKEAIDASFGLRQHMISQWNMCVRQSLHAVVMRVVDLLDNSLIDTFRAMDRDERNDILLLLAHIVDELPVTRLSSHEYDALSTAVERLVDDIAELHTTPHDGPSVSQKEMETFQQAERMTRAFQDMDIYREHYCGLIDGSTTCENLLVSDNAQTFRSSAYINRVPGGSTSSSNSVEDTEGTLYICEKASGSTDLEDPTTLMFATERKPIRVTVTTEIDDDVFTISTVEKTTRFIISGVKDPESDELISLDEALVRKIVDQENGLYWPPITDDDQTKGVSMTIGEAVQKQKIVISEATTSTDFETSECTLLKNKIAAVELTKDREPPSVKYVVTGVVDTATGKVLSPTQALRKNIILTTDSAFISTADGSQLPFTEALQRGYIISEPLPEDASMNGDTTHIDTLEAPIGNSDFRVDNVLDPRTMYRVSFPYAVSKGIVEPAKSEYRNPDTGEFMALSDAVEKGVVKASKVPTGSVKALVNLLQLHDTGTTPVRYILPAHSADPNVSSYKALSKFMDSSVKCVINHDGEPVSIREAYQTGLIKFDCLSYVDSEGNRIPLEKAAQEGLINMPAMQCILGACKKLSLQNHMYQGKITPDGEQAAVGDAAVPLSDAISSQKIDPYSVYLRDNETGAILTLGYALEEDVIPDLATGLESNRVNPKVTPSTDVRSSYVIEKLGNQSKDIKITNPATGEVLSLRDAFREGVYDTQHAEVINPETAKRISLPTAIQEGYISPTDARALYNAMDQMSLDRAMKNNMQDGEWLNPDTKSHISLQEAIEEGFLVPETVFFIDQATGRIATLATGIKDGKLDCLENSFMTDSGLDDMDMGTASPTEGVLSIPEAVNKKVVVPEIKAWRFIDQEGPLKDFINAQLVGDKSYVNISPDNTPDRRVMVKDALAAKLLSLQSTVQTHPQTDDLTLIDPPSKYLTSLVEIPKAIDFLADIELKMAAEAKPAENKEDIASQVEKLQALRKVVEEKKPSIGTLMTTASSLLASRPQSGEKNELEQQQYQQLRIVTSNLNTTLEKVNKQAKVQTKRLQTMMGFIDEYVDKKKSFDEWMGDAETKVESAGSILSDLEELQERVEAMEQFQEEINLQDQKVIGMQTTCFKFMAEANEYGRAMDAYRETIHKPLPKENIRYPKAEIQAQSDQASQQFKQLKATNAENKEKLEKTVQKAKDYKTLADSLEEWAADAQRQMNIIHDQDLASCEDAVIEDIESDLHALFNELATNNKQLDKLRAAQEKLAIIYEENGQPEKVKEIQSQVESIAESLAQLESQIESTQTTIHDRVIQSQNVHESLKDISDWTEKAEQMIKPEDFKISLNNEKLKTQTAENQNKLTELKTNDMKLAALAKESPETDRGVVAELQQRLADISELLATRETRLDDTSHSLTSLLDDVSSLDSWIMSVIDNLRGKSEDMKRDPVSMKPFFEELYDNKKDKQPELDKIKDMIEELLGQEDTSDKSNLMDVQSDICTKWHDFTELLIQYIVVQALRDIEEVNGYFLNCENSLLRVDPITIDSKELQDLLKDHKTFHEKLEVRRENALDVIQKCSHMLRETTKEEGDVAKGRIEHVRALVASVWKLSNDRLHVLEETLPMVQHFHEHHADVATWLDDVANELSSLNPSPADSSEQIRKQQDTLKSSLRDIDDHRPLIEDINNTGQEVKNLCSGSEAARVQVLLDQVNEKYDEVKADIRNRLNALADSFRKATSEVQDALDGMLNDLNHLNSQIDNASPVASTVDKIMDQIQENKAIMEDTADRQQAISSIKQSADQVIEKVKSKEHEGLPEEERIKIDVDEIESKIEEMESLNDLIKQKTVSRGRSLEDALAAAHRFWDIYNDLMSNFKDIQDSINSQDSPQVESVLIGEQDKEHREITKSLQEAIPRLEEVRAMSEALSPLVGESGKVDLTRHVEEASEVLDEIGDILNERQVTLKEAMEKASQFEEDIENVLSWLPKLEETITNMGPVALDIRSLKIQIEEVKILKLQAVGKCVPIESINSTVAELKNKSEVAAENFIVAVEDINNRWNKLVDSIFDREQNLQDSLIQLGELDASLEDINGYLQQVEDELSELDHINGDPKFLETHIKKLKMMQDDLDNQESVVKTLNSTLADMNASGGDVSPRHSPLLDKQEEMNELWKSVNSSIKDKRNKLQDKLTGVKSYLGQVEDVVNWMNDFESTLKAVKTIGALPDTAQKQCEKFNEHLINLNSKNDTAHSLIVTGEEMLQGYNCHPFQTVQIRSCLAKLRRSCDSAKKQAKKKKAKLQEHLSNVTGFHHVMKIFTDWLITGETSLSKLRTPSKLVEPIEKQIGIHKAFQNDVEAHKEIVDRLDRTGTYLKYYGAKHDAIIIRNQLLNIKLRWKRLLWKTEERGRLLQSAHREDKRFADDWKTLVDWLDETKEHLHKLMETKPSPSRMKEIIDEIKRFEKQIGRKHPRYYSTTRLGRNLKDRCVKTDPEREVLHNMLEELKHKWTNLRTEISQKQTQLDEQLLQSGRLVEASKSLIDWLEKSKEQLSDKNPNRGDQDTVSSLIEQHKAFQDELNTRKSTLNTLQQTANPEDPNVITQLKHLDDLWSDVEDLTHQREITLEENLIMATDFQTAVNTLRDFLPQAEQELKFQPLPEHELAIMQLMERHEKFEDQLEKMIPSVEKIKELGAEIMDNCHPNAVRFVKYYLTITHTRWEQLLERSRARRKRLEDALDDIQGNLQLLEDLIAYLSEAEVLLFTKEEDEIPEDLGLIEDLLKQHMEFHEELQEKGKEVEKFSTSVHEPAGSSGHLPKLKTDQTIDDNITKIVQRELLDPSNPAVNQLLHKWRSVWKMSVDRKKRLHDILEHLMELESVKNFNFELWRQRYLSFVKTKKARITDFFRAQSKNEDGTINRPEFVQGMMESKFPTNKAELSAVFNIFDRDHSGSINYREFIEALRPGWMAQLFNNAEKAAQDGGERAFYNKIDVAKKPKRAMNEAELVHDEIEREVSTCKCRSQFRVEKVDTGKYRFGESQKMVLVRFLNSTVMVRVGGGWVTLQKFLENHDPCKVTKERTNLSRSTSSVDLHSPGHYGSHSDLRGGRVTPGADMHRRTPEPQSNYYSMPRNKVGMRASADPWDNYSRSQDLFYDPYDPPKDLPISQRRGSAKGRTNTELREQFVLPEGASQARATFSGRRSVKSAKPGSDAGYSSGGSSIAGNRSQVYGSAECLTGSTPRRSLSGMHRSRVTPAQSMQNLSTNNNTSLYGSTSSLAGRKGAVTPTPRTADGRATPVRRKAATPTPRSVARTPPPHR